MSETSLAQRLGRHLEGWQLGLWVIFMALLSLLLAVPRNVPPELVPPPVIDRVEQRQAADIEAQRAARGREGLSLDIRSVGEAVRRQGRAAYSAPDLTSQLSAQLRRLATEALARHGAEPLLALRALQAQLFVAALTSRPPQPPAEAIELAGGLMLAAERQGWLAPPPVGADDDELATLYRLYWSETTGLRAHPFALSVNEWRVYYRFMLGRPTPEADRAGDLRRKLEYVAALASHDQEYPAHLARGVLLYQSGAPIQSAIELQRHLAQSPDGPWSLRARNYLAACGALLSD